MTNGRERPGPLRIWLPAIRAGSGADVFTERLAAALIRHGVDATITWFPHLSELVPDMLRRSAPPVATDIVHANSAYAFAFKRKGIPLVVTEHHYVLDPAYRPYKSSTQHLYHRALMGPYLRRSYAMADAITTDSRFTARVLEKIAGIRATRTIPLWVDYDEFSPASRSSAEQGRRPFRLLFVGNASKRKGADIIPLLARRLGMNFEIGCTSGLRQHKQDAPPDNVRLLGRLTQPQLVQAYRDSDAVLVPSRYEGFGYSALEAMACAKPVIGFRCGAIEEVVVDEKTGLLCAIDDVEALEASCKRLANDRGAVEALGAAGRSRATRTFDEGVAIAAYLDVYRRIARKYG